MGQQRFVVGAITTRLTVTVPGSIVGGDLVRVAAPDGSYHSVVVPSGLSAGQQFSVELLAGHADGTAGEVAKLRVELDAEKHLRRDLQQEANRFRSVRHRTLAQAPTLTLNRASPAHTCNMHAQRVPGIRGAAAEAPRRQRLLQGQHQEAEARDRQLVTTESPACMIVNNSGAVCSKRGRRRVLVT